MNGFSRALQKIARFSRRRIVGSFRQDPSTIEMRFFLEAPPWKATGPLGHHCLSMIILFARRSGSADDAFEFKIFHPNKDTNVFSDRASIEQALRELGVTNAEEKIEHACRFGLLEIPDLPDAEAKGQRG